jgi:hypothetical protein
MFSFIFVEEGIKYLNSDSRTKNYTDSWIVPNKITYSYEECW